MKLLEPCIVDGDPGELGRVVLALIDNAVEYTHAGGTVTVVMSQNGVMLRWQWWRPQTASVANL